ncbi:hypothetical protein CSIM01_03965 [Colletotrichum simmondsii]|uniref:Carboxylic ester hydrolase n=1 Tax=Colletotrichum simmondsii TaxID=703756 RepID=A0A135TNR9_9PEZI|nr:hypothetical protein CSIM01_03965 [Colletotrichum simmondsii]
MKIPFVACLAGFAEAKAGCLSEPITRTKSGAIVGAHCSKDTRTKIFQGIPYAQPPLEHLRFMPPEPHRGDYADGIFRATSRPNPCIQWPSLFDVTDPIPSEDCLYLDVYTPANATSKSNLPVKIFAYGGSNVAGALSYPLYDGCNLATDAVVVSFNYRLGPLGFLSLDSAGIKGNMAVHDYIAALNWVKENIAAFGGDNEKMVLFGQSAGADDTFAFSALPQARGLVSSVILESGGGQDLTPYDTAQLVGSSFAATLGCRETDLPCMQGKSVKELQDAFLNTPALLDSRLNGAELGIVLGVNLPNITSLSSVILDGELFTEEPMKTGSKVPVIAGYNQDDATLLVLPIFESGDAPVTEANYTDFLSQWGEVGVAIGKAYPLENFNSTGSTSAAVVEAISYIVTQASFGCPSYRTLRATINAGTPAFAYCFSHTPSCPWISIDGESFPTSELAPFFGSTHTAELPFVFGNLQNQPFGNGTCQATLAERKISHTIIEAWTAMAAEGNPATMQQQWPGFSEGSHQGLRIENGTFVTQLNFSECQFWDQVWAEKGGVNFTSV